eukprot:COSAG01_NODE_16788_length_1204_cov_3.153846_2_plen_71_part_00
MDTPGRALLRATAAASEPPLLHLAVINDRWPVAARLLRCGREDRVVWVRTMRAVHGSQLTPPFPPLAAPP